MGKVQVFPRGGIYGALSLEIQHQCKRLGSRVLSGVCTGTFVQPERQRAATLAISSWYAAAATLILLQCQAS
jgi:hypothetical protein